MNGDTLMRMHGLAPATLANMQRSGRGILADLPRQRGVYTLADSLLIMVYQELEAIFGTTSDRPAMIVRELRPRLQTMAATGAVPNRFKIRSESDGSEFMVSIPGYELLERARQRMEEASMTAA
jgi:hypothetical protein